MVIGIAAILVPLAISKTTLRKEIPIMIGVSLLLVALSVDGELSSYDGLLLLAVLIAFTIYTYKDAKKQREKNDHSISETKTNVYAKAGGLIAIGVALLGVGAYLTVENAVVIAKELGMSEKLIGLTVIAIGTSLPELITSIIAIRKGHTDIGVGNMGLEDLKAIATHQQVVVSALCDVDQNNLQAAAQLFPEARLFSDYRQMMNEFSDLSLIHI